MEELLFDENGVITRIVREGRLAEVGGILFKWAYYGDLEAASKNGVGTA